MPKNVDDEFVVKEMFRKQVWCTVRVNIFVLSRWSLAVEVCFSRLFRVMVGHP